jgi:hypothetical protein
MLSQPTWRSLEGPCTRDWWAYERGGERLALVQPFDGGASVRFYLGDHPWEQREVRAASVRQGKRFAARWLASRIGRTTGTPEASNSTG